METQIKDIEYLVPSPDKQIGSLSFAVDQIIIFKEGQKIPGDAEAASVVLSEKTADLAKQLAASILEDLLK